MRLLAEVAFGVSIVSTWGLSKVHRSVGFTVGSAAACVALTGAILDHGGWALPGMALVAAVTIGATALELRTRTRSDGFGGVVTGLGKPPFA